ncbi:MAG: tRNA pseudouridine(38-40) synthase TruA [Acidimicrobiales bacterium]
MSRLRAVVAYDGGGFHGFAANDGVRTVAGSIEAALAKIAGTHVSITCAGRTDKGVHARAQVLSFDCPARVDPVDLRSSLNSMLGPEISFREVVSARQSFDARFSAIRRTYRYRVLNADTPDPFLANTSWYVRGDLEVDAMNLAGGSLVGTHDFSSFCRKRLVTIDGVETEADPTRVIRRLEWVRSDEEIVDMWVTANAFCHQMVRSIAGTLVEVGRGSRTAASLPDVLAARDRRSAGPVAPARGLTLWQVDYEAGAF